MAKRSVADVRLLYLRIGHLAQKLDELRRLAAEGDEHAATERDALVENCTARDGGIDEREVSSAFGSAYRQASAVSPELAKRVETLAAAFDSHLAGEVPEIGVYGELIRLKEVVETASPPHEPTIEASAKAIRDAVTRFRQSAGELGEGAKCDESTVERMGGLQAVNDFNRSYRNRRAKLVNYFFRRCGGAIREAVGAGAFQEDAPLLAELRKAFDFVRPEEIDYAIFSQTVGTWHKLKERGYGRGFIYPDREFDTHLEPFAGEVKRFTENANAIASLLSEHAKSLRPVAQAAASHASVPVFEAASAATRADWRQRLQRAREAFLENCEPRLAADITAEPKSDTYHHPRNADDWLSERGYRLHLDCRPVRPPLEHDGWFASIAVWSDGADLGTAGDSESSASRAWRRFRDDAERAVRAYNDAPAAVRAPYGGAACPDTDGWLAVLFRAAWAGGAATKFCCEDGEPYREGDGVAWFACLTHLADASADLIDAVLAASPADELATCETPSLAWPVENQPTPQAIAAPPTAAPQPPDAPLWRQTLERSRRTFEGLQSPGLSALFAWSPENLSEADDAAVSRSTRSKGCERLISESCHCWKEGFAPPNHWPIGLETPGFTKLRVCADAVATDDAWRAFRAAAMAAARGLAGGPNCLFRGLGFRHRVSNSAGWEVWLGVLFSLAWRPANGSPLRASRSVVWAGTAWGLPAGVEPHENLGEKVGLWFEEIPDQRPWFSVLNDLPAMSAAAIDVLLAVDSPDSAAVNGPGAAAAPKPTGRPRKKPGPKTDDQKDAACYAAIEAYRKFCQPKLARRDGFWDWYLESDHDLGEVPNSEDAYRRAKNYADRQRRSGAA